jgi:hypothetical protein
MWLYYTACKAHVPLFIFCGPPGCAMFFHIIPEGMNFAKLLLNMEYIFLFAIHALKYFLFYEEFS